MPSPFPAAMLLTGAAVFALAACTTDQAGDDRVAAASTQAAAHSTHPLPAAGPVMHGDSFAMMSEQYTRRAGPYTATGASAWVAPAPAPAFVASGPLPPADAPAPPPAAVANRQPAAPAPAAPASELVRPEAETPASAPAPAAAERDPALRTAGLALFNANTCGACHAFADAGSSGGIGPSLDSKLAVRTIVNTLTEGRGAMPSFAGVLSDAEMLALANYLHAFSR